MNRELFRSVMEEQWSSFERDAEFSRDSNLAIPMLSGWYQSLSIDDRKLADELLADWVHSSNDRKQFDALALISEFKIGSAVPSLDRLAGDLKSASDPESRFLRAKVLRLIDKLTLQ